MTAAEVFDAIKEGRMTAQEFDDWVSEVRSESYDKGAAMQSYVDSTQ